MDKETILVLLAVVNGFAANIMNPDVTWLSLHNATNACFDLGLDEKKVSKVMKVVEGHCKKKNGQNPLSKMF